MTFNEQYYQRIYSVLYEFCQGKELKETAFIFRFKGFREAVMILYRMEGNPIEQAENSLKIDLWNMVKDLDLKREEKADVCRCLYYVKGFVFG